MMVVFAGCALAIAGCDLFGDRGGGTPQPTPECDANNPCPAGQECVNGVCVDEQPSPECDENNPCPEGQECVDGVCVPEEPVGGPCTVEGADPEAGETAYAACSGCHGADGTQIADHDISDMSAAELSTGVAGENHMPIDMTEDEARDIACWLFQQQG